MYFYLKVFFLRLSMYMSIKGFFIIVFMSSVSFSQNTTRFYNNSSVYDTKLDSLNKTAITKNFVLGKFDYKNHNLFTKVNAAHASKDLYLNKEVYSAFMSMYTQAKADGIALKIQSGTRSFAEQKVIWERKWEKYKNLKPIDRAKKILEYSSMPSTSRHHWGTDIDLNSFKNSYFESGEGKKTYTWLLKHANSFGFYQVYTNKTNGRTGYNLERWHWSYIPFANKYIRFYNTHINYSDVIGFEGSELAEKLHIISDYVNGISEQTKIKTYTD